MSPAATKSTPTPVKRFCLGCGKPGPFPTATAVKCKACTQQAAEDRKTYQREYQAARSRAVTKLIARHNDEYLDLLHDETGQSDYLMAVAKAAGNTNGA